MKIKNIQVTSILIFLCSLSSIAQDATKSGQAWTLEQCIDYGLKNNISVKQSELNTELANVNYMQSKGALLPAINGNASHTYNIGTTVDRFTNKFANQQVLSQNLSVSADITLFDGLQNINTIKEYNFNYQASKFDIDKMKNDISLSIATYYLQILFNTEALQNAKDELGITQAQVDRTKKLVEAGSLANGTLLDIQSQAALEELNVTTAQNNLDISYLTLAQLLNLPKTDGFSVVKPEITIASEALLTTTTPVQIYNAAITNLPEIKSADFKLKSADKAVKVAWGGLAPRLTFGASYGTGYSGASTRLNANNETENIPFTDQYRDNVNKSFGFYLTVPIFNKFQTKSSINRARIEKQSASLTTESTRLQVQKNIEQAFADAGAALKKYTATQKALDAMKESFKYTEQKFNVGMVNTTDYNTAKNKLSKTESDLLQAKYEYVFKIKVLDFYQGKPFKL